MVTTKWSHLRINQLLSGLCQDVVQSNQLLPSLLVPNSGCPHTPFILWLLWRYDIYVYDPCLGLLPSHHHHNSTPRLPHFPLGGPLWEVGGCLLFGLVCSPRPLSLALETLKNKTSFEYQHTLICRTCRNQNRHPSSLADNPDFGLFSPPDGIAVFLIFYYYFSY